MNKILIILQREYLTRVRKRTFLLMTFLTPVLFAALFTLPIILAVGLEGEKTVMVLDKTGKLMEHLEKAKNRKMKYAPAPAEDLTKAKKILAEGNYYGLVYIPVLDWEKPKGIELHSEKGISMEVESQINRTIELAIEKHKMQLAGIKQEDLNKIKADISLETFKASGEKSSSGGLFMFGIMGGMIIYFAIFLYGSQVMRGVVEEKTSRIIEVIISTVKPFQLMMGKILGVGLVGVTQFVLWILLTLAIVNFVTPLFMQGMNPKEVQKAINTNEDAQKMIDKTTQTVTEKSEISVMLSQVNMPAYILVFLFYFVFGYLMYASLFAAAASAVDNESEMQQFVMPITIPLIMAMALSSIITREPDGVVAFWMSIFPLTSPVTMLIRYPFGVPAWQLGLSMVSLFLGFIAMVWLAARIYRVGILMYGKKVNYKELAKWIFYK